MLNNGICFRRAEALLQAGLLPEAGALVSAVVTEGRPDQAG